MSAYTTRIVAMHPSLHISARRARMIHLNQAKKQFYEKYAIKQLFTWLLLAFVALLITGCSCEDPKVKFDRLMTEADEFVEKKDFKSARITLLSAVEAQPKNALAYFKLAEVQVHLEQLPQAVENYTTSINYDPEHRESRLHLASIMLAARQYETAENHVTKLLEKNAEDVEALILMANLEAVGPRKNYSKAKEILSKVLKKNPENVSALASFAHAELNDNNPTAAEEYFGKALKVEPGNGPLQMALADLYSRQGRLDEAQQSLEKLVEQNPEETGLRYIFGEFLLRRGQSEGALEQYEKTIVAEPGRHHARDRLYDMYLTRRKVDKAKGLTASLAEKLPNDPGLAYFEGRDLELNGKQEEALQKFISAMQGSNSFAAAFRRAGLIEMQIGKTREGVEHLNQAIAIDGGDVGARLALARHLYLKRELSQSSEHVEQVLKRYPRQLGANLLRADIALLEGDLDQARKVYNFFIQAFPKNPNSKFKMGLLEERSKNFDKAAEWYRETLKHDENVLAPARRLVFLETKSKSIDEILETLNEYKLNSKTSKGEYSLLMGSLHLANSEDEKRYNKARAEYEEAIKLNPNLIGAYYGLAAIDAKDGDLDGAIVNYKKLLEKNDKHIPTHMLLAMAYERKSEQDKAAEEYRTILSISPKFGPAANNLAFILVDFVNGDLDEALRLAEIAKEQMPKDGSVADTLGWVYHKRGSSRAALPIIEEALELEEEAEGNRPPNPEILYHLAEVRMTLEDQAGARKAAKQALSIIGAGSHPKKEAIEQLLGKIG